MALCPECEKREDGLIHPTCARWRCPGINLTDTAIFALPILPPAPKVDELGNVIEEGGGLLDSLGDLF